jgi:hypothetical protein
MPATTTCPCEYCRTIEPRIVLGLTIRSAFEVAGHKLAHVTISPLGRAIVDCFFARPSRFAELCFTSDGFMLGRAQGDCGANQFIGPTADLARNIRGMIASLADTPIALTPEEREAVEARLP